MRPHEPGARPWLELLDDEVEPTVLEAVEPDLVVWSTLWPSRPDAVIRFDVGPDHSGTSLRWTLTVPDDAQPPLSTVNHLRFRLNLLINDRLRTSYGQ